VSSSRSHNEEVCSLLIGDKEIKYLLARSSRRTIGISIEKNGVVKVTSPFGVSDSYIKQLLQKKSQWVFKKIEDINARQTITTKSKAFEEGESFSYLGKGYKLKLIEQNNIKKPSVQIDDVNIVITLSGTFEKAKLKNTLVLWYIEQFKIVIQERIKRYSDIIGVSPNSIVIKEQKTRWGSCSSKGNINLNWKLIMAPQEVIDYVVIHELCHMREMNHSKQFWRLVEEVLPKYKEYKNWLKHNGDLLNIE